jgi:colicin import membrane protein
MKKSPLRKHSRSTLMSIGFHVAVVIVVSVGVRFAREPLNPPAAESVAIQATVVDESLIEREMARIEQQEQAEIQRRQEEETRAREQAEAAQRELEERERQLEAAREEQEQREQAAVAEEARLADLQRQRDEEERRRQEAERQRLEEEQRVARLREEEEQRQREAAERQQREEAERQQREEQERLAREAEAARQQAQLEAELQNAMAAEEERRRAEEAGLLDEYRRLIQSRIEQAWIRPASAGPGLECQVNVIQIPSGDVIDVRVGRCNGDPAVVRSIEQAVLRASPLPQPPTPALFSRSLELIFEPDA